MVSKAPGLVSCRHCAAPGAALHCPSCGLLVCDGCAADWRTCPEPRAREMRLGITARLRDVDRDGAFGLVSHWWKPPRLFHIVSHRFVDVPALPPHHVAGHLRVLGDGHGVMTGRAAGEHATFAGVRLFDLATGEPAWSASPSATSFPRSVHVSHDEHIVYYAGSDEVICIVDLARRSCYGFRVLATEVVQALALDRDAGVVAVGTYGRVDVHRLSGEASTRASSIRRPHEDIAWLAVLRDRLACVAGDELSVYALDDELGPREATRPVGDPLQSPVVADVTPDGRRLAIATASYAIAVHDFDTGQTQLLKGHTDRISVIRFCAGDRLLITGDYDNRVVLWPRSGERFADKRLEVEVGEETIAYEAAAADAPRRVTR